MLYTIHSVHVHIHLHVNVFRLLMCVCTCISQIQDFSMSHVGSLDSVSCSAFSCVEDSADHSLLDELCPIVYRARNGPTHKTTAVGASQEPLFSVAMEMKLDKERNSMVDMPYFCYVLPLHTHIHTHTHFHLYYIHVLCM